ncbi:hypothetical protein PR048_013493, partial [Dryococelus australis]
MAKVITKKLREISKVLQGSGGDVHVNITLLPFCHLTLCNVELSSSARRYVFIDSMYKLDSENMEKFILSERITSSVFVE